MEAISGEVQGFKQQKDTDYLAHSDGLDKAPRNSKMPRGHNTAQSKV